MKKLMFLAFTCIFVFTANMLAADEEDVTSALQNDAQIQKAENLSAASIKEAENNDLTESEISTLSDVSGVSTEDIAEMRASGMGWGEIAHEIGVHPSVLGLGHTKQKDRQRDTKSFSSSSSSSSKDGGKGFGGSGKNKSDNGKSNNGNSGNSNSGKGGGKK